MPKAHKLSELAASVADTIQEAFGIEPIWVTAQITDVKLQPALRRCYLKMIERAGEDIIADLRANIWAKAFPQITEFERVTGQAFRDGLEITALVTVKFSPRYGLSLDIHQIDVEWALGSLERERQLTLSRLVKENPETIRFDDGEYITANKILPVPLVARRIALITAPNSDGQRDFQQELLNNRHGYTFHVIEYLTTIQGDQAHLLIIDKLEAIRTSGIQFDLVCIVRGGGSQTDFKPFDRYELAKTVAEFPIPVLTGIGHDRNTSITDLMARQQKTPTKVAASIIDINTAFEDRVENLRDRCIFGTTEYLRRRQDALEKLQWKIRTLDPQNTLKRGFAIVEASGKVVTDVEDLREGMSITTHLKNGNVISTINQLNKAPHENAK